MTVRARQLARRCRERLAAQQELPGLKQQPRQQQAAAEPAKATARVTEAESHSAH
jgi:hypothetical protein